MAKVVIWDAEGSPPLGDWTTVLWRGFGDGTIAGVVSISKLIEENADVLRRRYLAWIYDLGETRIKDRRLVDHLELWPGFSYWWMSLLVEKCNYGKSPQIADAIRLMAFDGWAADRTVGSITLTSANRPLAECLRLWWGKLGVAFEWQRLPMSAVYLSWGRRSYQSLPPTLQALAGLLRYLIVRFTLRGAGLKDWQHTDGRVTFVSYLFNLVPDSAKAGKYESPYWAHLPDDLQSEGCKTNWLHLYVKDALLPGAGKAADIIREFNKAGRGEQIHATLDTFLSVCVVFKALSDWARLAWTGRRLQQRISTTASEGLNLWPLFVEDWRQSTGGFTAMSNALNRNLFQSAMKSLPKQRVGVYLQENQCWEFGLIQAWKGAGHGRLVGVPHSSVRFWDLRYFFDSRSYNRVGNNALPLPDKVALNGKAATDAYLAGGYPATDLVQVEALRYLYLGEGRTRPAADYSVSKGRLRLLVLGDYLSANTRLQMRLLEKAAQSLPAGTIITVKPHPACPIRPEDYPGLSITVTMASISTLLPDCDVAYASAVTSAAVDAHCAGVPVVSVLDPSNLNLSPLRGCAGASFAGTPEELAHELISAASAPRSPETRQNLFTTDPKLPRWRQLLLDVG